jgi:hypothetical protein
MEGAKKEAKKAIVAEQLSTALSGASTIQEVADAAAKEVRSLNFKLNQSNIAGIGNEAKVVGQVCGLNAGEMSAVLLGENGAFVVITQAAKPAQGVDYANQARTTQQSLRNLVSAQAFKALQDKADVDDKRWMMF